MIYRSRTITRCLIALVSVSVIITLPIYWLKNHREILNLPKFIRIASGELPVHANWDSRVQPYVINNQSDYYISESPVTFSAYDIYTKLTFKKSVKDNNWGRDDRPVINISWQDAVGYIQWINLITFSNYRLPTESEWEYAARAGSTDRYNWGPTLQKDMANCLDCLSSESLNKTTSVKEFDANALGIYDAQGNVWEWMYDCYHQKPDPVSQSEALTLTNCDAHYVKGGSWANKADYISPTKRFGFKADKKDSLHGFRLAYVADTGPKPVVFADETSQVALIDSAGADSRQNNPSARLEMPPGLAPNLIQNGDFAHDLSGWRIAGEWEFAQVAEHGMNAPGALRIRASTTNPFLGTYAIWQCVQVDEHQLYDFGASYRVGASSSVVGGARMRVVWNEESNCTGKSAIGDSATPRKLFGWQILSVSDTRPVAHASSVSISIILSVKGGGEFVTYWDDIYLRPKYKINNSSGNLDKQ